MDSQLCLARPIFRGIAPDLGSLNPWLKERIEHHLGLYRAFLRPLLLDGLVFHHTPWLPLRRATPWCVLEYASRDRTRAALAVFRLAAGAGERYQLRPRGLDRGRRYLVTFDNCGESAEIDGLELAGQGLSIAVGNPYGSEMVLCQALA